MLKNYFKVALRNLKRYKGFSFINISGLAIGISLCLMMFLFVNEEFSYDKYIENSQDLYRLTLTFKSSGTDIPMASTSVPVGPELVKRYPEVIDALRLRRDSSPLVSSGGDNYFYEDGFFFTEAKIFDIFSINFISGDPGTALALPNSIVLTKTIAEKYFGREDPMGKVLKVDQTVDFTVTGIVEDPPRNTHFKYKFLAYEEFTFDGDQSSTRIFSDATVYTYLIMERNADIKEFESKLPAFVEDFTGEILKRMGATLEYSLQKITDIHLYSEIGNELGSNSDIAYSYIFSSIALFILLIACINFMNLSTARSVGRLKEVGMRKVLGAYRSQLVAQFIGESIILAVIGFVIAVCIVAIFLPELNSMTDKELSILDVFDYKLAILIPFVIILIGFFAGSYPALYLSAFQPAAVIKSSQIKQGVNSFVRKTLVVFQFTVSIILIIGTFVFREQLNFLYTKDLGFQPDQLLVINFRNADQRGKYEILKNDLLKHPDIISGTGSQTTPGSNGATGHIYTPEGGGEREKTVIMANGVDFDFVDTYEFEVIEGRNFSKEMETDAVQGMLVNEALVKRFDWQQPIGKKLTESSDTNPTYTVIGVLRDFHHFTADQVIRPFVIRVKPREVAFLTVKLRADKIQETIEYIENTWKEFAPGFPFEYSFVDEAFELSYRSYSVVGKLVGYFTALAVFIACLGLYGLASFTSERRTKEIGIRKTLGASIPGIITLLIRDFIKWVIIANVIALPAAYFLMKMWLQDFEYRVEPGIGLYLLASFAALMIAVFTTSFQSLKAARMNPVEALRNE